MTLRSFLNVYVPCIIQCTIIIHTNVGCCILTKMFQAVLISSHTNTKFKLKCRYFIETSYWINCRFSVCVMGDTIYTLKWLVLPQNICQKCRKKLIVVLIQTKNLFTRIIFFYLIPNEKLQVCLFYLILSKCKILMVTVGTFLKWEVGVLIMSTCKKRSNS